jgi:hypothetical protein
VLVEANPSAGQAAPEPVQFSWTSQIPADGRHDVLDEESTSAGQVPLEPVHTSCGSQTPSDARQVEPPARNVQVEVQHEVAAPFEPPRSHCSALPSVPLTVSVVESPQVDV